MHIEMSNAFLYRRLHAKKQIFSFKQLLNNIKHELIASHF